MKTSIITVVLNNEAYIENCIKSVLSQTYKNVEYIIVDGGSTDRTVRIIRKYEKYISTWISDPDRGIYDAMNKGIKIATGDVVGILNSDDMYADGTVIRSVVNYLSENGVDACYGDLVYVDCNDTNRQVRYWKSGAFNKERFRKGWMPPHPTFFVRRHVYERYGLFNLAFPLAADYELMLRFLYKYNVSASYIPKCLVKMRTGGRCHPGLANTSHNVVENYRAWKINGLKPNIFSCLMKPLSKIFQYRRD
ncbi:MAG: glycosyltransferase family 2 protein [Syntrophales bacterium]